MFDWISDAIDWISDGISSLWDNTVGAAADAISDAIWDIMFEWIFNKVYGLIAELFTFINETATDIFALSWVQVFVGLFGSFAWMLFVCGLVVAVFDTAVAYESGQANIKNTCINVLKGFMAASLVTVVPQRLYSSASICRVRLQLSCLETSYPEQATRWQTPDLRSYLLLPQIFRCSVSFL